jgi:HTH-type transcriptional regulator/antitoxin HipB
MTIMAHDNDQAGAGTKISTVRELGQVIQATRKEQAFTQMDIAGLAHTGNRFIVDLENGKPTIQMQKVLDILDLLGLELVVQNKGTAQ